MFVDRSFVAGRTAPLMLMALAFWLLLAAVAARSQADEKLFGIACRSVHFGYRTGPGDAFYNEVTVRSSAPGTFFMVCGWNAGYFGMQELDRGRKVLIFSVWDPGQGDDPNAVDPADRVKLIHQGEGVRVGRFGGEGTGGQSFLDFDWKNDETYRFMVRSRIDGVWTEYEGWFFDPERSAWRHLITFATRTGGKPLDGCYSFIEDFKRNRESTKLTRSALFGNGWYRDVEGNWNGITGAQFTGDGNPATNIDSRVEGDRFFLATGGEIENVGTKLWERLKLETSPASQPDDLHQATTAPER